MPRASKKKSNDPLLDVQNAINRKMYHGDQTNDMFICKHDLDLVWADHPLRDIFPNFEPKEWASIRESYICVLSTLVLIDWTDIRSRFRPVFLREHGRDDEHLPFTNLDFLGTSGRVFSIFQHAFKPVIIEEYSYRHVQEVPSEYRLPFINEPEDVRLGGYGSVTKRIIAPRCLKNKENNQDNSEPKVVACKIYRNENPLRDFKQEVRNLDYIKESLTDAKRVMKHIAAIVHGNTFMILLPHADLFDLEIFLRYGFEPDPSTDDQRKIYDFDTKFPMLTNPVKLQRAVIEEAHQLASALEWLHEYLKIPGYPNLYLAHMDLKPENVLIVGDSRSYAGKWMLSDFGVSSFDAGNARVPNTPSIRDVGYRLTSLGFQDRIVRGHGPYQPPEVDLENVDGRKCDVWSFSCVMCDVLAFAIGRTEAVHRLRNLRYNGGDDYFYRTKAPLRTEIDNSSIELKPQIVQWWETLAKERSSPGWATNYVSILRKALQSKPSDRPDVSAIVRGLDELARSIATQETAVLDPESESLSNSPLMNGTVSQYSLTAQQRRPAITISHDVSPPHRVEGHIGDLASTNRDHGHSSSAYLSPDSALQRERGLSAGHEVHASQSSSSSEGQDNGGMPASDTSEPQASLPPEETFSERRTSSVSMLNFKERSKVAVSPPKKDKVLAVTVNPSPLQVAILCKNAVHLYLLNDGEEKSRHINLTPKVDWKKIRLASHYFAVYGVESSNKKIIEIFDLETISPVPTFTSNGELPQDILLSDKKVFAYVYRREVKLYYVRLQRDPTSVPTRGDDAFIVQAKFSASGKILCVWASGTRGDHAYFYDVNEELGSYSLCGEGSYQKQSINAPICEIWPFPDSPACIVHEAHAGTFLAQPLDQPQAKLQQRGSVGISNALTGCVVRDDLLVCLTSRTFHPGRELYGFALSQEPTGQRRIARQGQNLGAASKGIKSSTAIAVHIVGGKVELVLCTTAGEVLQYIES